jgi:hypothetical protein
VTVLYGCVLWQIGRRWKEFAYVVAGHVVIVISYLIVIFQLNSVPQNRNGFHGIASRRCRDIVSDGQRPHQGTIAALEQIPSVENIRNVAHVPAMVFRKT